MEKREIVQHYLNEHQDVPSRTAAKWLFNNHKGLWESLDQCYKQVLYYRGENGKKARQKLADGSKAVKIPAPKKRKSRPVALTDSGRWFIVGDLHVPFHDQKAVEAAINYAIDRKCDHLLLNGDILDAYQQSAWVKDPTQRHIDDEINMCSQLLKAIQGEFRGRKVYKIGNHEARIETYLFTHAPRMIGMSKWNLCDALRDALALDETWDFIASKQLYTLGKLNGYHGHELPRGLTNPVNVGRGLFLRTKQNGFTNHWHATSTHIETSGNKRKTWVCFSVGCLCDLHPEYGPVNNWNHGFAYVDIDKSGNFSEANHRIVNGEIW